MIQVEIREDACRGCQMCVELCPVKVFVRDEALGKAKVVLAEDCFGCLSCAYLCPSGAIRHRGVVHVKNFYRDLDTCARVEKFL